MRKLMMISLLAICSISCEIDNEDCLTCELYGTVETVCEDNPEEWRRAATKTWDEYRAHMRMLERNNDYMDCY